jgi:hypothetical protein
MSVKDFAQNSFTREFIIQTKELVDNRVYDYKSLSKALDWNKSAMSSVINGYRNIPIEKWEVFKGVYKNAINSLQKNTLNMETKAPDYVQELINSLKKNIEVLEKNAAEKDDRVRSLLQINSDLKTEVRERLKTVLENQLTLTALFESYLKSFSSLMIDEPEQQQEFRLLLHKEAFVRLTGLLKTGRHLAFDNESIVSKET